MKIITQEEVKNRIIEIKGRENCIDPQNGKIGGMGPDLIVKDKKINYYIEAIAFSKKKNKRGYFAGTGQNQSDFWKAFSQAISRLNPDSVWGKPDRVVIALPMQYRSGWQQRVNNLGEKIWKRIGNVFPELGIWFVFEKEIVDMSWNNSYTFK